MEPTSFDRAGTMIICHSRKFVLIRPRKVASSSIQWAFLPTLTKGDLVMRLDKDESDAPVETEATIGHVTGSWPHVLRAHSPLSRLVKVCGEGILDYSIVTLARNPWDRTVSEFYYVNLKTGMKERPIEDQRSAFAEYVRSVCRLSMGRRLLDRLEGRQRISKLEQSELCLYKGQFRADHVIFFENLAADLAMVGQALDLDLKLPQKAAKGGIRAKASRDWRGFYTDETRDLIARHCAADIERYGYAFDGGRQPLWSRASA